MSESWGLLAIWALALSFAWFWVGCFIDGANFPEKPGPGRTLSYVLAPLFFGFVILWLLFSVIPRLLRRLGAWASSMSD